MCRTAEVFHIDFENLEKHKLYSKVIESDRSLCTVSSVVQGDFIGLLCIDTDDFSGEPFSLVLANFTTEDLVSIDLNVHTSVSKHVHRRYFF